MKNGLAEEGSFVQWAVFSATAAPVQIQAKQYPFDGDATQDGFAGLPSVETLELPGEPTFCFSWRGVTGRPL